MKIGILGSGQMGTAIGKGWAAAGHDVVFGARRTGNLDEAAAFGDVILFTVRGVYPSKMLRDPRALDGKIVIDVNNRELGEPLGGPPYFSEELAADVPRARVVKAFNTVPHVVIALGKAALTPHRVTVFVAGDDAAARSTVIDLAGDLGFVGRESGHLVEGGRLLDAAADFIRFHIATMGLGPLATLSINLLNQERP